MSTVTQWFSAARPPARVGNYDFRYFGANLVFNVIWDGYKYIVADGSIWDGEIVSWHFADEWRGLAEKPGDSK